MDPYELLYLLVGCCGLFLLAIAVFAAIFALLKKKYLIALLLGLPLLCIGCSMVTGGSVLWWDSDTYVPDDLSDTVYYDTDDVIGDGGGLSEGYVVNSEYGFSIYVGEYDDGVFGRSSVTGATADLLYCLPTTESSSSMEPCDSGYFPAFSITVMTWDQWADHISEDSMGMDFYTKVGDDAEYVYLFSHPNGEYPSDVPSSAAFFDEVIVSFEASE